MTKPVPVMQDDFDLAGALFLASEKAGVALSKKDNRRENIGKTASLALAIQLGKELGRLKRRAVLRPQRLTHQKVEEK